MKKKLVVCVVCQEPAAKDRQGRVKRTCGKPQCVRKARSRGVAKGQADYSARMHDLAFKSRERARFGVTRHTNTDAGRVTFACDALDPCDRTLRRAFDSSPTCCGEKMKILEDRQKETA